MRLKGTLIEWNDDRGPLAQPKAKLSSESSGTYECP